MENSERLSRQTRPGFEPGISRLPVLSAVHNIMKESSIKNDICEVPVISDSKEAIYSRNKIFH